MRQVIENIHHNTMTAWDTAKSLEKILSRYSPGEHPIVRKVIMFATRWQRYKIKNT
ncbi:MAG: hypothetical protein Q7K65_02310 [Candidatus Buchananbacteria bacterium]|nr:hypothetical protein [Candidatus Buchananbacteria bacterium]